ncbi:MAG: hypothetical protein AAFW65_05620 [Pseudomonadota bacterium]
MSTDEDVLTEIVKLLGSAPDKATFRHDLMINHEWLGSVLHILSKSEDLMLAAKAKTIADGIGDKPITVRDPRTRLIVMLQQMKREFEFKVGYSIPRNYVELSDYDVTEVVNSASELKKAVVEDNELETRDREILLSEIAIFEASLGVARLSPELISRFVNGVLRGAIVLAASESIKKIAGDLTTKLFDLMGWPLSG